MLNRMSVVFISTPMATMAWPAFKAAVTAAARLLGYQMATAAHERLSSEAIHNRLKPAEPDRDEQLSVAREGVMVTFSRNVRGKVLLCVTGNGHDLETLHALGEEMSQAVVQQYICRKLRDDVSARGFDIVEEVVDAERAIRLKVRHWDN